MGWQDTERGHTGMAMVMNEMGFRILDSSGLERCEDFFCKHWYSFEKWEREVRKDEMEVKEPKRKPAGLGNTGKE